MWIYIMIEIWGIWGVLIELFSFNNSDKIDF